MTDKHYGAAEARRARNPEGSGSKPDNTTHVSDLFFPLLFYNG